MKTSFNGANFEQTNRFQFRLNIIPPTIKLLYAPICAIRASASACLPVVPFPLLYSRDRFRPNLPLLPPPPSPRRLYRSSMERLHTSKTAGYSSASYRYVNVESRSRWDRTCISTHFRVHFCMRLRLFETNFPSFLNSRNSLLPPSWSVDFRPFSDVDAGIKR